MALNIINFIFLLLLSCFFWFGVNKNIGFFIKLVVGIFAFANSAILCSIFGFFNPLITLLAAIPLYFICSKFFGQSEFIDSRRLNFNKIALLLLVIFLSIQLFENYYGGQDAITDYLPLSRHLALMHKFPSQWFNLDQPDVRVYKIGYPGLLPVFGGFFFQIFGLADQRIAAIVPALFFILFLFVFSRISFNEKLDKKAVFALFIISLPIIEQLTWFYEESPLVFFCTLLYFSLLRYESTKNEKFFQLAMLASGLCIQTKYIGFIMMFITIILGIYWKIIFSRRNLIFFILAHAVGIGWYLRNLYLFGLFFPPIPFGPSLNIQVHNDLNTCLSFANAVGPINKSFTFLVTLVSVPVFFLWAFTGLFAFKRFNVVNKLFYLVGIAVIILLNFFVFLSGRFLFIFLAPAIAQICIATDNLSLFFKAKRVLFSAFLLIVTCIVIFHSVMIFTLAKKYFYKDEIVKAVNYLKTAENSVKGEKIFVDSDFGFRWIGGFHVLDASEPFFAPYLKEAIEKKDIRELFERFKIKFAVDDIWKWPFEEKIFGLIKNDSVHFKIVYQTPDKKMTVWRYLP